MAMPRVSRRRFLQSAAMGTAAIGFPSILRARSPNERLQLAFIAAGGRGGANLRTMTAQSLVDVEVVALCDVDRRNLDRAAEAHPEARKYTDFRKLYDDDTSGIDAVVVSTCEH